MSPPKPVAASTDVDNDATAELPVLDVAAYESTLNERISIIDTWSTFSGSAPVRVEVVQPAVQAGAAIPTLRPAGTEDAASLSGTHEMPAPPRPNKVVKATLTLPASASPAHASVRVPPSPPLIEELRGALAAAERRIEELNERARIADADRSVASARAAAESAQLREQLGLRLESLSSARGRHGLQDAERLALEDELFARGDRIEVLRRELEAQAATLAQVRSALDDG
jgi:hypothetical protein